MLRAMARVACSPSARFEPVTVPVWLEPYRQALAELNGKGRLRVLAPRAGADFTSNDYLGIAGSARMRDVLIEALVRGVPAGAGGSRLLRGNTREHEQLEAAAAAFFQTEAALFFGSGYLANYAVLSSLPQREDLIVLDGFAHASANEGARAGRARIAKARHNDLQSFQDAIDTWRAAGGSGRVWIAIESLYSMDGDRAPLEDFVALADRHQAVLFVDEAHATGVYGPDGRGLAAQFEGLENIVVLHTCSKALGGAGALVTGPRVLADFLVNRCRPFIYATAPSPLMAVAALEALCILKDEPERRQRLGELVELARDSARQRSINASCSSQIVPVIIGDDVRTMALAASLQARGFDVRGIRPPTVPEGTARLRIALTLNVDGRAVSGLFEALAEEYARLEP
jgi:8-amino-7-oxononanoate synthase